MFGYTDRSLPPEIYQIIYSHLSRRDLARLLRSCRAIFDLTVPYLWQNVSLGQLLHLIPACTLGGNAAEKIQFIPFPSPDDYFARFDIYASQVESLRCDALEGFPDDNAQRATQSWISEHVSDRVLLPRLKRAIVRICMPPDEGRQRDYRFWVNLLVPDTLKELMLWTNGVNDEETRFLHKILSGKPGLTHLNLNPYSAGSLDPWDFVKSLTVPSIQELVLTTCTLNDSILIWMSQMIQLRSLKLLTHTMWPHKGFFVSLAGGHQYNSFGTLEALSIDLSVEGWPALGEIWRTPIVRHIIRLGIKAHNLKFDPRSATHFLTTLAAYSPKIQHIELTEDASLIMNPNTPKFPASLLQILRSLPLRTLRISRPIAQENGCSVFQAIGNLWPDMEELCLWTSVEPQELMGVSAHLPRLRHLQVSTPSTKRTPEPLSSDYEKVAASPPDVFKSHLTLNLYFDQRRSDTQRFDYDLADLDFLARMLALLCQKVCVSGPSGSQKYSEQEKHFMERFHYHSDEYIKDRLQLIV